MKLTPFLLDQWLSQALAPGSKIEFDLGASTGPVWTLRDLLALDGRSLEELLDTKLVYTTPAGTPELRAAIGEAHGVDPDHVQVLTGGAEALLILFFLAAETGANVVLPNPGYPPNAVLPQSLGTEIRYYTLRAENDFRVDCEEIRRLVDRNTRMVIVNSPHNPTGAVLSDEEMASLHDFCADRGVPFVADEVYHPIYHGSSHGGSSRSAVRLAHATVLGDFSKALCVSGLRTGWLIEPDAERRRQYLNARSYFTVSNAILSERLATIAMRHRDAIYARARQVTSANLLLLDRFFSEYSDTLRWVRPRGGMTAFPWLADGSDGRAFCEKLTQRGVMTAPGDCFGMPRHFRLGFGKTAEMFPLALERIAEMLAGDRAEAKSA